LSIAHGPEKEEKIVHPFLMRRRMGWSDRGGIRGQFFTKSCESTGKMEVIIEIAAKQ
jgi:hypothetical protein